MTCDPDQLKVNPFAFKTGAVQFTVFNPTSSEVLVTIERESWKDTAATAALVTSLQAFRNLFPQEAVAPGEEIGISSLAVLFTDLKDSTSLYQRVGDPRAFGFVQNHFRYLVESIARHQGGIVKTIGDAIMATFASSPHGLRAALDMQKGWSAFSQEYLKEGSVQLKIGLHEGTAIVINHNGRMDYFGATVNMAARIESQSQGGDVVISQAVFNHPEVQTLLHSMALTGRPFTAELKGIQEIQTLYQIPVIKI